MDKKPTTSQLDTLSVSEKILKLWQLARREPRTPEEQKLKGELLAQAHTWKPSGS